MNLAKVQTHCRAGRQVIETELVIHPANVEIKVVPQKVDVLQGKNLWLF